MRNLETEFKWDASAPYAFFRMLTAVKKTCNKEQISEKKQLRITDVYLDHPDQQFEKEQLAFRIRHYQDTWEATFKTRTQLVHGKAVRQEETLPLPNVHSFRQAVSFLNQKKSWKKLPLVGLQPLFTICNKRIIRQVLSAEFEAELSFDNCIISTQNKKIFFKEIELELKSGRMDAFEKFVKNISVISGLKYATASKVKTAVNLLRGKHSA